MRSAPLFPTGDRGARNFGRNLLGDNMRKYKSEIYEVLHQDALADFEVGAISEDRMREYGEMCFVKEVEVKNKSDLSVELAY